jgi:hypothetical protein
MWGKKKGFFFRVGGAALLLRTTWVFASTLGSAKEMLGKLQKNHQAKYLGDFFLSFG